MLEAEQAELHQKLAEPTFYRQAGAEITKVTSRLQELEQEVQAAYARWEASAADGWKAFSSGCVFFERWLSIRALFDSTNGRGHN